MTGDEARARVRATVSSGAAVIGSNLYAVGYVNSNAGDYLVAKYNTDGSVAWSHSFGGTGADYLNSAVALNGRFRPVDVLKA